jgi:membrane protein
VSRLRSMFREIARTTAEIVLESSRDGLHGEAAKAAYFFFLSLFPLILVLFAVTGIVGGDAAFVVIMEQLRRALPADAAEYLGEFVAEVTGEARPGVLSIGILIMLWAASNSLHVLTAGLNTAWRVAEARRWWRRRALAVVALLAGLLLLLTGALTVLIGPEVMRRLGLIGLWEALRWPVVFVMIVALLWLVYSLLPNLDRRPAKRAVVLGAVAGTTLWLLATAGFRAYVANYGALGRAYGVVGGILILLVWLYLTAYSILLGGKVAAILDRRGQVKGQEGREQAEEALEAPPSPS